MGIKSTAADVQVAHRLFVSQLGSMADSKVLLLEINIDFHRINTPLPEQLRRNKTRTDTERAHVARGTPGLGLNLGGP